MSSSQTMPTRGTRENSRAGGATLILICPHLSTLQNATISHLVWLHNGPIIRLSFYGRQATIRTIARSQQNMYLEYVLSRKRKGKSAVSPRLLFLLVVDGPDSTSRFCATTFVQPLTANPIYGLQQSRMSLREPSACYIRDYVTPPFSSCTGVILCCSKQCPQNA